MNPKQFLQIGGAVLLLVGILGFIGVIGPTPDSLFGAAWFFDNAENIAHTVLGVVAVAASMGVPSSGQKPLVIAVGVLGLLFGLYSLFGAVPEGKMIFGASLQNPADTILHFVVGVWALWASKGKQMMA
ncbi:hypothetical protein HZA86_03265 [Candidatus Uhrbacteria bacterium]|nr:hypothetical protein [Candidatus Uhrbacteria bacterium]